MSQGNRDNNNTGTLGKNANRQADNHPEYTGQCIINGVPMWINGWVKTNRSTGEKFFSLSFRPKDSGNSAGGRGNGRGGNRGGYSQQNGNNYQQNGNGGNQGQGGGDDIPF